MPPSCQQQPVIATSRETPAIRAANAVHRGGGRADAGYRFCAVPRSRPLTAPAWGEERGMSKIAGISESANELERLIADLSESGPIIFVFGPAGGPRT
jgi:hypothetical protein